MGNVITGTDAQTAMGNANGVFNYIPIESMQITSQSQLMVTENNPWKMWHLGDYLMLDHDKTNHQPVLMNNYVSYSIDTTYNSHGVPNCFYSPAFAPSLYLNYTPKNNGDMNRELGVILIAESINISFI